MLGADRGDAGVNQYLCGFAYYASLCHGADRSLFVHVPEFDSAVTVDLMLRVIKAIIARALEQRRNDC
ncbi:hypothetical protein QR680_007464 [Steinernema hermaphroditum]|uniref:Pyrrolidone-carboxylate peptidase n=1 Tax=Steinernema hermaphroditum TaxID=289476 RepID=A0AA39IEN6_9BILA|nr:hypothetical protein QR680_007464 [Steinernema hermaphroditum]